MCLCVHYRMLLVLIAMFSRSVAFGGESHLQNSVYIEHTDAMGIMLNSQFPRYAERSLQSFDSSRRLGSAKVMKYSAPGKLGDDLLWSVSPGKVDGYKVRCARNAGEEVLFTAWVQDTALGPRQQLNLNQADGFQFNSEFNVYRDELHSEKDSLTLSTLTTFNLFERARSDILGGPSALRGLMEKGLKGGDVTNENRKVNVVVARVKGYGLNEHDLETPDSALIRVIKVFTDVDNLGAGLLDFHQAVAFQTRRNSAYHLLARATVTCLCTDAETNSPADIGYIIPG